MSLCHLLDCYLEHNGKLWEALKHEENLVVPRRVSQICLRKSFETVVVEAVRLWTCIRVCCKTWCD